MSDIKELIAEAIWTELQRQSRGTSGVYVDRYAPRDDDGTDGLVDGHISMREIAATVAEELGLTSP